jgi:hypothetical protein
MDTFNKVVLVGAGLATLVCCPVTMVGYSLFGSRQSNAIDHARNMDQQAAMNRAVDATLTALAPAAPQPTQTPEAAQLIPTAQPTYTTTAMPTGISGVDDVYGIIISGNRLGCCKDCNYNALVKKITKLTGQSGTPTYLQINDDSNTVQVEYGKKIFNLPQPEETIDTLLNLTNGYFKEIVTVEGNNFRGAIEFSGHSLDDFASVLGGSYYEALNKATQVEFSINPSGDNMPQINIYVPGQDAIQHRIIDSNGKPDFVRYTQLLHIGGVPGY